MVKRKNQIYNKKREKINSICHRTNFVGFLCLVFVFSRFPLIGEQSRAVRLDALPTNASAAALFRSSKPDPVSVKYLPGGGENGRGSIVFQVLKPFQGDEEISGPALKLERRSEFVSRRQVRMEAMLKMKNAPDTASSKSASGSDSLSS